MKKIFITLFIILVNINQVIAWECKLKDKSAPGLLEYIKNNRAIIKNISSEIINSWISNNSLENNFSNDYSEIKSNAAEIYNEIFNFDSYYSYFTYFAVYPIKNEVPKEVKRDYNLLVRESEWIKYYLDVIVKNWKADTLIDNPCQWVNNCDFDNSIKAWDLIWILTANNDSIMDLYRNSVIWEIYKNPNKIILVDNNFEIEIQNYYWVESYGECSNEKWWFFDRIYNEWIKKINENIKLWKDWIKKWREAIDLMLWNDTTNQKYVELERKLLKNELSKQWIYWDSQTNMLDALDKYNSEWFSKDNNFIVNTFNNTRIKLEKKLRKFKEEVIGDFFDKKNTETINVKNILDAQSNSTNTNDIKEKIDSVYLEMLNLEWMSEMNTSNLRNRIINVHIDISNSINTLELTCPKAVKVCNEQDYWRWNCWKCN